MKCYFSKKEGSQSFFSLRWEVDILSKSIISKRIIDSIDCQRRKSSFQIEVWKFWKRVSRSSDLTASQSLLCTFQTRAVVPFVSVSRGTTYTVVPGILHSRWCQSSDAVHGAAHQQSEDQPSSDSLHFPDGDHVTWKARVWLHLNSKAGRDFSDVDLKRLLMSFHMPVLV